MGTHSVEWWEGYNCRRPRIANPYRGLDGKRAEMLDWTDGWECRFFGESP